jgi:hypothetical protein
VPWWTKIHKAQGRGSEPRPKEFGHPTGLGEPVVQPATSYFPETQVEGRVGVGGMRALRLLVAGTLALFCLGISLSFLASVLTTNAATTTTEVCCAPAGEASGDAHGEALVRPEKDTTSGPLTTPGEEAREGEKLSVRASLLTSMLVLAASPFFGSGLVSPTRNSSLKGGVSHPLGVLGGLWAAGRGGASLLGVFLL